MKSQKLLSVLLCLALLCGAFCFGGVGVSAAPADTTLRYGADGKFRILVFTDTHKSTAATPEMEAFIGRSVRGRRLRLGAQGADRLVRCRG